MRILIALWAVALANAQPFTAAQRQADLNWIRNELPRRHANLFAVTPRADFDRAASMLSDEAPALTDEQFYTRLMALAALGRDAHTFLGANNLTLFPPLTVLLRGFDDGIFVTAASDVTLNAAQVLAVNGTSTGEILEQLRRVIPYENESWFRSRAPSYLANLGILRGLGVVPSGAPASVSFRLASGEIVTRDLGPRTANNLVRPIQQTPGFTPATLRRLDENYWAEYWPATRTLYIAYRVCAESPNKSITQFVNEIAELARQGPIDNALVDLRGNGGGNSAIFERLMSGLLGPLEPLLSAPGFRGYGLIDRGTFSSGMLAAVLLKQNFSIAPLYGEATGGSPTGYGEVLPFTLPGSGLTGQYSTKFFSVLGGAKTVEPDVAIGLRSTDYFARHDPLLAHIYARTLPAGGDSTGDIIVLNAASLRPDSAIAPGAIATAFAAFGAPPAAVKVNGIEAVALGATPGQVSFVVPPALDPGPANVEAGGKQGSLRLRPAAPALFSAEPGNPLQPAAHTREGKLVRLYATGLDPRTPVAAWVAEQPASVSRVEPVSGVAGLWLIETQLPENVSGFVPIFLATGGLASNAVTLHLLP